MLFAGRAAFSEKLCWPQKNIPFLYYEKLSGNVHCLVIIRLQYKFILTFLQQVAEPEQRVKSLSGCFKQPSGK